MKSANEVASSTLLRARTDGADCEWWVMKRLTLSILVTLAVLLGSAGESFALPECPGSHTKSMKVWTSWNNCEGTATDAKGDKFVGEWKDGKRHGQGT